jgi:hypothetical protein
MAVVELKPDLPPQQKCGDGGGDAPADDGWSVAILESAVLGTDRVPFFVLRGTQFVHANSISIVGVEE